MIELNRLSYKINNDFILKDINVKIEKQKITVIMGPNGSGKTTLLRLISGDINYKTGSIFYDRKSLDILTNEELSKIRSFLPQHRNISFPFSVKEVILMGRYPYNHKTDKSHNLGITLKELMFYFDIFNLKDASYNKLSGGESSRVDLCRIFAQNTQYILLDEPFNHLDPFYIFNTIKFIKKLNIEKKKTFLLVVHDLNIASLIADSIIFLKNGKIAIAGNKEITLKSNILKDIYNFDFKIFKGNNKNYFLLDI